MVCSSARVGLRLSLGSLLLGLWLGCSRAPQPSAANKAFAPLFDGCEELRGENSCELGEQAELVVWLRGPVQSVTLLVDDQPVTGVRTQAQGTTSVKLRVASRSRQLIVRVGARDHVLNFMKRRRYGVLEEAARLQASGALEQALHHLTPAIGSDDAELRARALSLYGRIEIQAGRFTEASSTLTRSHRAAQLAGLRAGAAKELFALANTQMQKLFELSAADRTLSLVRPVLASQLGALSYHRAALALLRGDPRSALTHARDAALVGEQLADRRVQSHALQMELMLLAELGRLRDARTFAPKLEQLFVSDPCAQALLATNLGWIELVAEGGDSERAQQKSREASQLYASTCPDRFLHQNALVNLALANFRLGALQASKEQLAEAAALGPLSGWVRAWAAELEGRLALAAGDAKGALTVFRDLQSRAQIAAPVSSRYRAAVGVGLAHKLLGDARSAVDAFLEAEAQLDQDARLVPVAEGRDVFVGEREESSRELVDILLKLGRVEDALRVARRARARALRTLNLSAQAEALAGQARTHWLEAAGRYKAARKKLDESEQAAWEVPLDERAAYADRQLQQRQQVERALDDTYTLLAVSAERPLSAPQEGELVLAFHALPEGWVVFAATAEQVRAQRISTPLDPLNSVALSEQLLVPFTEQITDAKWVKILPYGPLKEVAFHGLPFSESTLLDHKSVVYGGDLGETPPRASFATKVAVIADPRDDLSFARKEGELVADRAEVAATDQWFGLRATREAVSAALSHARLVHFAGHAQAEPRGVHSRMLLSSDGELDVGDILMLPAVPHTVILSGCETTRESFDSPVASLGLAQAFLARGAQLVVATTAPVPDAVGLRLMKKLYVKGGALPDRDSFREALLSVRQEGNASWLSYRALVP